MHAVTDHIIVVVDVTELSFHTVIALVNTLYLRVVATSVAASILSMCTKSPVDLHILSLHYHDPFQLSCHL